MHCLVDSAKLNSIPSSLGMLSRPDKPRINALLVLTFSSLTHSVSRSGRLSGFLETLKAQGSTGFDVLRLSQTANKTITIITTSGIQYF
jgi:hypothetical protein